jgi:hypothetical protein
MRRRDFIAAPGVAAAWPPLAHAQGSMPLIAKALSVTVPASLLARADEVIE